MKKQLFFFLTFIGLSWLGTTWAFAASAEPVMADYTAYPIISSQTVAPNIMIILDNSGSMNFNAYGTYPGDSQTVSDAPFTGEPYSGIKTFQVSSLQDDAEEGTAAGSVTYYNNGDLDLGGFSTGANDAIVGVRFQNVAIPQGVTIRSAYIEFMSNAYHNETTSIQIDGELVDDAEPFDTTADNIKNRPGTTAKVAWDDIPTWSTGVAYPTADITDILQELVNQAGWASGQAMVFRFQTDPSDPTGENKRDARAYDSNAGTAAKLHVVFGNDPSATRYYGYFNPDFFYTYSSNTFNLAYKKVNYDFANSRWNAETLGGSATTLDNSAIVNQKLWDGNWLNWLCMRRVDVLRKVLMGGKASNRDGTGKQVNYGEVPAQTTRVFYKKFDSSYLSAVSPYHGNYSYQMSGGRIYRGGTSYYIHVQKDVNYEPEEFKDGNLAGLLQKVGNQARWGNIWFNDGTGSGRSGGTVEHVIGTNIDTLVDDLQKTGMDTWTPLAETYYVAMQYFKQQAPAGGLDYDTTNDVPHSSLTDDPFYNGTQYVPCAKNFVLLLTDGASTKDAMIPGEYKNYDGHDQEGSCTENNCLYPDGGSDYLADLALYARTNDLRSATVGKSNLDGDQNLILYVVHAFDKDPNATSLLSEAARYGGADDDGVWDKDGDGVPDTFFEADDGYSMEAVLLRAIADILGRAASGTSASVLATNSQGEGNMVQAYFRPSVLSVDGLTEARWLGYLQSLWVDTDGVLHEDTNQNSVLDSGDLTIEFTTDSNGDTKVIRNGDTANPISLDDIHPIFEAGARLRDRDPATRRIFTYIDKNRDEAVEDSGNDTFDHAGEVISFDSTSAADIKPYLGVASDAAWGDGGAKLGADYDTRVSNIIAWERGTDISGLRNRTLDGKTWRLGDIINSTPVTVAEPPDQYHVIYSDQSYLYYWETAKDRETMVYVGANDGMLHAFTHGEYLKTDHKFKQPDGTTEKIGDEVWAFIPQSVLPHLKWVAQSNYTHTYLVDGTPKVFDAKILPNGTHYNDPNGQDNWGTFLVMGLNMGAKHIEDTADFGSGTETRDFDPTYFMLDITDPRNPRLMWERTYPNLSMSRSRPAPVKVGDDWFLVFGSGPTDYDGSSSQGGYLYVADLKTGQMLRQFGPLDSDAFFNDPASFDKNLNYNVDAIYTTDAFYASNQWQGGVYKVSVPCTNCDWASNYDPQQGPAYATDPAKWTLSKLFASDRPITAPVSVSVEVYPNINIDNVWVYFGTGRYLAKSDIADSSQQYLYGIKDPFFNSADGTYYHDFSSARTLTRSDLFPSDTITVTTAGNVLQNGSPYGTSGDFGDLENDIQNNYSGWYRKLDTSGTGASERDVSKMSLLGGMAFAPVFTPDPDICKYGGQTSFYALYYATGTGYIKQMFDIQNKRYVMINGNKEEIVEVKLPDSFLGTPPPGAGMHAGTENGASAFLQQSTGRVLKLELNPPFYFRSAVIDWWDE